MELDQLHENCTGKNGESPEGRQMKPNGFPTFSKTSQCYVSDFPLLKNVHHL